MKARKLYLMECHVAGRQYHDADEVWNELNVGTELHLVRDLNNYHDKNAIAVVYRRKATDGRPEPDETQRYLLGFVPRCCNEVLAGILEMGWTDIFECRLSRKDDQVHYEQQLHITIRIKPKQV